MSDLRLSDLFQSGAVVALHRSAWRANARILPRDLGLPDTMRSKKALALGVHRLAAAADFADVNRAGRDAERAIERVSLAFPLIPAARYVQIKDLEALAQRLAECVERFNAAADEAQSRYPEIRANQMLVIRAALVEALQGDEEKAEAAVARIGGEYPSAIRGKFALTWQVYTLQSAPSETVQALAQEGAEVRSVLRGMVEGLRDDVATKLGAILETVAKGGQLSSRSIGSALQVLERVDEMNILGDATLAEQSRRLRKLLNNVATVGEVMVVEGLRDVQQMLGADLATAVAEAEARLTGLGRRKLSLVV